MNRRLPLVWSVVVTAWIAVTGVLLGQTGNYRGISPGFDFPADRRGLLQLRNRGAVAAMRRHAWMVFAGMTQPAAGGLPVWETWFTADEVFDPTYVRPTPHLRPFAPPAQLRPSPGDTRTDAADESSLSYILFNDAARRFVHANKLYSQAVLTQMNSAFTAATPVENRQIPVFPPEAMATKSIWWVVKKAGVTPVPIWDPIALRAAPPNAVMPSQSWTRVVGIDPSRAELPPNQVQTLQFD